MKILLVLKKDNVFKLVNDWIYGLVPTTYFYYDKLIAERYTLLYVSKNRNYALYNKEEKDGR